MGSKLGIEKVAAKRSGVTLEEYRANITAGLKRCCGCKTWYPVERFYADSSRGDGISSSCRDCSSERGKRRYTQRPRQSRLGMRFVPVRSGDKLQARARVNRLVTLGLIPSPGALPCADCGHTGTDRRHEYDHHLGYDAEHHESVQAVCSRCHYERTIARGENLRSRRKLKLTTDNEPK